MKTHTIALTLGLGTALASLTLAPGPIMVQAAAVLPAVGRVVGTVTVRMPPPRRTAERYGRAPRSARTVQQLPVLVWVKGPLGAPSPSRAPMEMVQADTVFAPGALIVPVGTTVRFPNRDDFFHNVFSYSDPARFDLGRYPQGDAKNVRFDRPGVVKVYCEVHESMRAVIVVAENPHHTRVASDGTFTLEGVPAGSRTLVFWHADLGEVERTVDVTDGGVARVQVEIG